MAAPTIAISRAGSMCTTSRNSERQRLIVALLDCSGSMQAALEAGRRDAQAESRLHAICRTVLQALREQIGADSNTVVAIGAFGTKRADGSVLNLLSALRAMRRASPRANNGKRGREMLQRYAAGVLQQNRQYVNEYIKTKLSDLQAGMLYVYLKDIDATPPRRAPIRTADGRPVTLQRFIDAIPSDTQINVVQGVARGGAAGAGLGAAMLLSTLLGPVGIAVPAAMMAGAALGGNAAAGVAIDKAADKSEALKLAKTVAEQLFLHDHDGLAAIPAIEAVQLLTDLIEGWDSNVSPGENGSQLQTAGAQASGPSNVTATGTDTANRKSSDRGPVVSELFDSLKPYIYGNTPLAAAMINARRLFESASRLDIQPPDAPSKKWHENDLLLVVSDGQPTDSVAVVRAEAAILKAAGVQVVTVYLTDVEVPDALVLHDRYPSPPTPQGFLARVASYIPGVGGDPGARPWSDGEKLLFDMATSACSVEVAPISVLRALQWQIPHSGVCSLFARVSTTHLLDEFLEVLLANSFRNPDALLDLIGKISMDEYVGERHKQFQPRDQGNCPTCYAHAAAAVMRMAMQRVYGRVGGVPSFESIRDHILNVFPPVIGPAGQLHGRSTFTVLDAVATKPEYGYRLHVREVDERNARLAVLHHRPVVATFHMPGAAWEAFSNFFAAHPDGVLTQDVIAPHRQWSAAAALNPHGGGHAVVVTRVTPDYLEILNSWGDTWANNGFFRVANGSVLGTDGHPLWPSSMKFYDVYWTESDLLPEEVAAFHDLADRKAREVGGRSTVLSDLTYPCPNATCGRTSKVSEYRGTLWKARCPRCQHEFKPEPGALAQALYLRHGVA